jgi:hypothetical protein
MDFASRVRSLWSAARGMFSHDRKTTVICPAAELPAKVTLDSSRHIQSCSRHPEPGGCNEACMPQIEFCDSDLQDFLARYEGKQCTSCGVVMTGEDWYQSRLATLKAESGRLDRTEKLASSLREQNAPICSTCYSAQRARALS